MKSNSSKVETKDIFGSTSEVNESMAANTEIKEGKKTTARKTTSAKTTDKKPVKETVAKKTESIAAKLNEVKNEVKADIEEKKDEAKAIVDEVKAVKEEAPAKKRGRKPGTANKAAAKPAAKKTGTKKEASDKPEVKPARKQTSKKTVKKELFFQYNGQQVDEETLVARITEDAKSQNVDIKDLKMYLKPEDNACYYVANGNVAGKVDLY